MDLVEEDRLNQFDPTYMRWLLSKDAVICHDPSINERNYDDWLKLLSRSQIKLEIDDDPFDHPSARYEREPVLVDSKPFIIFAEEGKFFHPSLPKQKREEIQKYCLQEYIMCQEPDVDQDHNWDYCPVRPVDVFYFFQRLHNSLSMESLQPCNINDPQYWDRDDHGDSYDYYKEHPIDAHGRCCQKI